MGAIDDLKNDMSGAAKGVLESVVDQVCSAVTSEIESALNELRNCTMSDGNIQPGTGVNEIRDILLSSEQARGEVDRIFSGIEGKIGGIIADACGNNQLALSMAEVLTADAKQMLSDVKDEVLKYIPSEGEVDLTEIMSSKMNDLKLFMIEKANGFVDSVSGEIGGYAQDLVNETEGELQGYIDKYTKDAEGKVQELTEEAAEKLKQEISGFTDSFIDDHLKIDGPGSDATDIKSSPAAMFKFGYKDYLMILTYISICCGDSVLMRTSDLIQMNFQKAGDGSDLKHPVGSEFKMSKANTYISVTATADLDMFFMDMGLFADMLETGETAVESSPDGVSGTEPAEEEKKGTQLTYKGLLGY